MKEDYCDLEIAKLLKEKGFDEDTVCVYVGIYLLIRDENIISNNTDMPIIPAPTHQMAMKYLREKHNIIITLDYDEYELADSDEKRVGYGFNIQMADKPTEFFEISNCVFDTYEESCESAITYCLTNLI